MTTTIETTIEAQLTALQAQMDLLMQANKRPHSPTKRLEEIRRKRCGKGKRSTAHQERVIPTMTLLCRLYPRRQAYCLSIPGGRHQEARACLSL